MKRLSLMVLIGSIIVSAGTCGDDQSGPLPSTPEEFARELCQQNVSSLGFMIALDGAAGPGAKQECSPNDPLPAPVASKAVTCGPDSPVYKTYLSSIQAGRVKIDAQKMRACVRKGRNARQGKTWAQLGAMAADLDVADKSDDCRNFAVGTVAANQPCRIDIDCAGDQVCRQNPADGKESELICVKPLRGKCTEDGGECGKGEICHRDVKLCVRTPRLVTDLAAKRRGEGAPCDSKSDCLPCMDCRRAKADDAQGVCTVKPPKLQQGAKCEENNDCVASLYCKGAIGSKTDPIKVDKATCQPRSALNGQCAGRRVILNDYFGPLCLEGLTCDGYGPWNSDKYGKCVKTPGVGEDCSTTRCGEGSVCVDQGSKRICAAVTGNVGDACDNDDDCNIFKYEGSDKSIEQLLPPSSNYCDGKTQKCALKKAANGACEGPEQCEYGTLCRADGKCQSSIDGAKCDVGGDCDSGECITKGTDKVCAAKSPNCLDGGVGFILFALMIPLSILRKRKN